MTDQHRDAHDVRRDVRELEGLQAGARTRPLNAWTEVLQTAIEAGGLQAARDFHPGDTIVDLLPRDQDHPAATSRHQPRQVAQHIPAGTELRVGADGRVYGVGLEEPTADRATIAGIPLETDDEVPVGRIQLRNLDGRVLSQVNLTSLASDEPLQGYVEKMLLQGGAIPFANPVDTSPDAPNRYDEAVALVESVVDGIAPGLEEIFGMSLAELSAAADEQTEQLARDLGAYLATTDDIAGRVGVDDYWKGVARAAIEWLETSGTHRAARVLAELDQVSSWDVPEGADPLADLLAARDRVERGDYDLEPDPLADLPAGIVALEEVAQAAAVDVDVEVVERLRDAAAILRASDDGPEVIRHAIATGLEHAARTLEAGNPVDELDEVLEIADALAATAEGEES